MTSGSPMTRTILLLTALLLALPAKPETAPRADFDGDALIASLARPAPASVDFKEIRYSTLLREPLVLSGELGYSGPTNLDRHVTQPYREDTAIRGESVRVEREGEQPRSFALKRAPELRGLLTGFTALLAGDADALKRSFDVHAIGPDDDWTLQLTPTDARARKRLKQIVVYGSGSVPRCFSMLNADGGASIMLLGDAVTIAPPRGATVDDVLSLCRTE